MAPGRISVAVPVTPGEDDDAETQDARDSESSYNPTVGRWALRRVPFLKPRPPVPYGMRSAIPAASARGDRPSCGKWAFADIRAAFWRLYGQTCSHRGYWRGMPHCIGCAASSDSDQSGPEWVAGDRLVLANDRRPRRRGVARHGLADGLPWNGRTCLRGRRNRRRPVLADDHRQLVQLGVCLGADTGIRRRRDALAGIARGRREGASATGGRGDLE